MAEIKCFWLELAPRLRRYLRRYAGGVSCGNGAYHNAMSLLDVIPFDDPAEVVPYTEWEKSDSRWPKKCANCDYMFQPGDPFQVFSKRLWTDGIQDFEEDDLPIGAMVRIPWFEPRLAGPDTMCLAVQTPGGFWLIDGLSSDGGRWQRTGIPPALTVTPSILIEGKYHGFLTDGVLKDT